MVLQNRPCVGSGPPLRHGVGWVLVVAVAGIDHRHPEIIDHRLQGIAIGGAQNGDVSVVAAQFSRLIRTIMVPVGTGRRLLEVENGAAQAQPGTCEGQTRLAQGPADEDAAQDAPARGQASGRPWAP